MNGFDLLLKVTRITCGIAAPTLFGELRYKFTYQEVYEVSDCNQLPE
jgi:hypothetical protein